MSETVRAGIKLSEQGRHVEAIARLEAAIAVDPDDTQALLALARTARALGLARPAEEFYRKVLALTPSAPEAVIGLANLLRDQARFAEAEALLSLALKADPLAPELWLTQGSVHREAGDTAKAESHYRRALDLRPDYPQALGNLADILSDRGEYEAALAMYDRVVTRISDKAQARLNRAMIHFLRGDLAAGWRDYQSRLHIPGKVARPDRKLPPWNKQWRRGLRLLLRGEQGIGDQIMFASMLPDLAEPARETGARILLECEPRLVPLFARSFPDFTVHGWSLSKSGGTITSATAWLNKAGGVNAAIEMGSLAVLLRPDLAAFPDRKAYLSADRSEQARWQSILAPLPRPHIGLCWRSGKTGGGRAMHYAPLEIWADFLRTLPGSIVMAQYDAGADEIARLEQLCGRTLFVPQQIDQKQEIDRAAALYAALDAMVSAPTATSWLAAAVGTPTCKVLRDPAWTSFGQKAEPFAPSARAFAPAAIGDWQSAFADIRRYLSTL